MSHQNNWVKLLWIVLGLFIKAASCTAGDNTGISISAGGGAGYMMNGLHIYERLIDTRVFGHSFAEINFRSVKSDDYYSRAFNIPTGSIGFSYMGTGDIKCKPGSCLGNLYSLYGSFQADLFRSSYFAFGPYLDWGISYTGKKYDAKTNPQNLYVGSNILMLVGTGLDFHFNTEGHFEPGIKVGLAHRSNGMLRVPNYGLNKIQGSLYLKYNLEKTDFSKRGGKPEMPQFKKWTFDVYFSSGVHSCDVERSVNESLPEDKKWEAGKQWLRLNIGTSCNYQYHPIFSTGLGIDIFYTQNSKRLEEIEKIKTGNDIRLSPVYCGTSLQQNFHYKNVMASIGLGVYIFKQLGPEDSKWNYQRVAIRYFFENAGNTFIGFAMRAHSFDRSDTWEFTLGKRF